MDGQAAGPLVGAAERAETSPGGTKSAFYCNMVAKLNVLALA
jgi:hypothetical protein